MVHEACDTSGHTESAGIGRNPGKIIQIVLNVLFIKFKKTDGIKSPVNRSDIKISTQFPQLIQALV
jgi:hypothetical protein